MLFGRSRLIWPRALLRLRRTGLALAFALDGLALGAAATTVPDYFTHLWEDGLPQNAVAAIVQTRDGYLWLGTYNGLVRFDGVRFTVFDNGNTPELHSSRVISLFEDASGALWIGHETGELTQFKDGHFHAVEVRAAWKSGRILGISADEADDLWLFNEEGLMARLRDGLVLAPPVGTAPGLLAFARDTRGALWVARSGKLSALKNGKLVPVDFGGESVSYVQGICAGHHGGLWVASDGRVRKWQENRWTQDLGAAPWGLSPVIPLLETRNGSLAGGTVDSGLFLIITNGAVLRFNRTNGLPQNWVRSLREDREGNLWIGAGSGGLVALRAGKVATLSPLDHWQSRAVLSVSVARNGAMWIGTEGAGLYCFHEGEWGHFGEAEGLSNLFVWSVSEDAQGRIWAGTWGGGVFSQRDGRFERVPGLETVTAPTPAVLHTQSGVTWIGTGDGLLRYEAGVTKWFGRKEGLELPDVRAVVQTSDGTVWFGMLGGGLGRLSNEGALRQFRKRDGLSSDFVQCLRLDGDGALWIGTFGGGLDRLKQGRFAAINTSEGLANSVIHHIEEDARGYFWLSSHGGVMRVSKAELNRCADGEAESVNCLSYGKGEGLPTLECTGGFQPGGAKTADGRLWFPTSKGLVAVDPNDVKINKLPPQVVVEEMLVEDQPVTAGLKGFGGTSYTSPHLVPPIAQELGTRVTRPSEKQEPLQIPPGRKRFEFHYTGLSFTVPEKVRFQYRLEGLEPEWVVAGAKRVANYSYVPPGSYKFHVKACNNDGVWNDAGAELAFMVLPHFWQTWWFRVMATLAAASAVAGSVLIETRRRMHRKLERLEQQRGIERERTRIAQDIHDDLGASLTRITLLSQTARSELDNPSQAAVDLDRIYGTARELTRAMDEIVWAVNPKHDTLDSLASYLGRFAQDFLGAAGIRCRLRLPLELPQWPLTAEVRHNLFLAFKESLHNAVKHAAATEVQISLKVGPASFVLSVKDNGCGFLPESPAQTPPDPARPANGNGLVNMRQRLNEIDGGCEIKSAPRAGTNVTFHMPMKLSMSDK